MDKLTPDEFKALYKAKGWKGKSLAVRWNYSACWISKKVNDPNRPAMFDDAVKGLPHYDTVSD